MIKNTIQTEQNVQIDYPIANIGHRIAATIIDYSIYMAYYVFIGYIITKAKIPVSLSLGAIFSLPVIFYYLAMEVFFNGQSVGKKILKLQVVSLNGERPTIGAFIIRWMFLLVDYTFVGLFVMLMSRKTQRIGDIIAGTTVIHLRKKISFEDTIYAEFDKQYIPVFAEAKSLTNKDVQAIQDVLRSKALQDNHQMMYSVEDKIKKNLGIESPLSGKTFLDTLIKDYNYYKQN